MDIRPIRNAEDLTWALRRIDALWNAEVGSPEGDELDVLSLLVERYEREHHGVSNGSPLDVIKFCMEQNGHAQADLARLLGSRSRASEILAGKRALTLDQIRKIHKAWKIPTALLVGELEDA